MLTWRWLVAAARLPIVQQHCHALHRYHVLWPPHGRHHGLPARASLRAWLLPPPALAVGKFERPLCRTGPVGLCPSAHLRVSPPDAAWPAGRGGGQWCAMIGRRVERQVVRYRALSLCTCLRRCTSSSERVRIVGCSLGPPYTGGRIRICVVPPVFARRIHSGSSAIAFTGAQSEVRSAHLGTQRAVPELSASDVSSVVRQYQRWCIGQLRQP